MPRDVCIIGGGIIGLCSAHALAERGDRVTVIDRHGPERDGCSYGNAGLIVPSHFVPLAAPGMVALGLKWMWNPESPFYIRPRWSGDLIGWAWRFWQAANPDHVARSSPLLRDLNLASRACYEQFATQFGESFGFAQRGLLMLCQTQKALDEEAHTAQVAWKLGMSADVLTSAQAAALDPDVSMDIVGAVRFPLDCHLVPYLFMKRLQQSLEDRGVTFRWETGVTGWRRAGAQSGRSATARESGPLAAVQTTQGEIAADEFVLCGGSWSAEMVRPLGLRLPMQAGKGYSLTLPSPPQLPRIPAIFVEARVAVTPMNGSLRFGGTMEIAGLDESITARRVRGIIRAVPRYYPAFDEKDFAAIPPWGGLRPCSPDGLPYLGRTRVAPNLMIATGHAMMGLSLGPVTGQIVAQLLAGETPAYNLEPLSPDRYA